MDIANRLMEPEWDNDEAKTANELVMHTGMRAGEIQALTVDDLGEDVIYVRRSWSKYDDLKCCKNGEERSVMALSGHKTEAMLNHYGTHLEDEKVVELARNVMKKVFIDQKEDEETINMLNQKFEELNKEIA